MRRCGGDGRRITSRSARRSRSWRRSVCSTPRSGRIARSYEPPLACALTALVSEAVGSDGLIGGQAADLLATDQSITFEMLERIHRGKTGALFSAAATAGALTAGAPRDSIASLQAFAKNLGLAFQIIDDLLDVEGDPAVTGKPVREDVKKTTFVSFSGPAGARQIATELCHTADRALTPFGRRAARAARALGVRRGEDRIARDDAPRSTPSRRRRPAATASLAGLPRRRCRSLRPRTGAGARQPARHRLLASLRIGVLAALLLGPAARDRRRGAHARPHHRRARRLRRRRLPRARCSARPASSSVCCWCCRPQRCGAGSGSWPEQRH